MPTTFVLAPAKVNLALRVLGRRADGHHDIATLFAFVDLCDTVAVSPRPGPPPVECRCRGEVGGVAGLDGPQNLAARAAHAAGVAAAIAIEKRIPVGAGLGGGSADAAAVLRALGRADRLDLAARLGADVPACLLGRPAWGTGRGDALAPLGRLPDFALVLAVPAGASLSTAEMYAALGRGPASGRDPAPPPAVGTLDDLARVVANDFEPHAVARVPAVAAALSALRAAGALVATITGKGPAAFGLYGDVAAARAAAATVRRTLGEGFRVLAVRGFSA